VNNSLLVITDMDIDEMYCACSGRILNSLNRAGQEALFAEFAIILIILFYIDITSVTCCRRSLKRSVADTRSVMEQLDDIEDHRPFFTYWVTTVQVLILIISLTCYGLGPVGIDLNHRSGQVWHSKLPQRLYIFV
jgi:hypothetical protein